MQQGNELLLAQPVRTTEVGEETGITGIRLVTKGPLIRSRHEKTVFAIHPFLFDSPTRRVTLDWENVESRWILPKEVGNFPTVPRLPDVLGALLAAR